ncbi:hypothetical protein BJ508DRAFT_324738 [Ascobolus immersus RN42]|uniref:Uncharacterized protein n=1 Tax=Ascobolus immersus RN42 TaxID=1160509 RepID=A0A3N4INJ2_ASCIM|nr:hypothetical protein BJ508DRAFT_324738 [Ascobolus immersus RN42]
MANMANIPNMATISNETLLAQSASDGSPSKPKVLLVLDVGEEGSWNLPLNSPDGPQIQTLYVATRGEMELDEIVEGLAQLGRSEREALLAFVKAIAESMTKQRKLRISYIRVKKRQNGTEAGAIFFQVV